MIKFLGADHVIDYKKENFTKNGLKYDIIFDAVRKLSFSQCKESFNKEGLYLTVDIKLSLLFRKKVINGMASMKDEDLEYLKEIIENGKIRPIIDKCYPLKEIARAHTYVEKGHKKGNVVIIVRNEDE